MKGSPKNLLSRSIQGGLLPVELSQPSQNYFLSFKRANVSINVMFQLCILSHSGDLVNKHT